MNDELLKALQLIKEECEKHNRLCNGCPMLNACEECGMMVDEPRNWALEKREVYF